MGHSNTGSGLRARPALMQVTVTRAQYPSDMEAVRRLFRRYADSLPFDLDYQNFEAELAGLPAPYLQPYGFLLLARRGGVSVGTVGLRRLSDGIAEIKRLYVVPEARGYGIGKVLLGRVIAEARHMGYERLRLDSHRASMTTAIAMYDRLGFTEIPPYGPDLNGEIAFFEKRLREPGSLGP